MGESSLREVLLDDHTVAPNLDLGARHKGSSGGGVLHCRSRIVLRGLSMAVGGMGIGSMVLRMIGRHNGSKPWMGPLRLAVAAIIVTA